MKFKLLFNIRKTQAYPTCDSPFSIGPRLVFARVGFIMTISARIVKLFQQRGDSEYGGEAVTQLEHALQCAALAEQENVPDSLVVAALLHDVGHLLHELPDDAPDSGVDDHHENSGYHFLKSHFSPAVTEPVKLHVAAKRYLCAVDADYRSSLSQASQVSLELQGGEMTEAEREEFRENTHYEAALRLRKWDDTAKDPEATTPSLEHFAACIDRVLAESIDR